MYNLGPQFSIDNSKLIPGNEATIKGSKFRIQILSERLIRIEYSETGEFVDSASELVINRSFPRPMYGLKEDNGVVLIETKYITLKYIKNAKLTEKSLSATIVYSKKNWFYTQKEVKNYGGSVISLDNVTDKINYEKGLLNSEYFVIIDDSNTLLLDANSNLSKRNEKNKDIYIFAYGNDFSEVLTDYYTLTGYPAFIPRYALGNWWSRDIPYQDEHVIALSNKFRMNGIPISVFLLDNDWSLKNPSMSLTSGFTFNSNLIKDPVNLINNLHSMGIRVGLKVNPKDGIYPHEAYFGEARKYINPNKKGYIEFNPFDARLMDLYFKLFIHPLENVGIDLFWNDYDILNKDALFVLNDYMKKDSERDGKRALNLVRNCNIASHRYPILYSGRNKISFDILKKLPLFNITAANIGISYWSHDIGGSVGGIENKELYLRSIEFGVFSPFLRFNTEKGTYYKREPWRWDMVTNNIVTYYLRLRSQLIPYIYTEMYYYHKEGIPIIKPFYYEYPNAYDDPILINQYYFGSSMLVAPIVNRNDPLVNRAIQRFYLPEGIWFDFKSGKRFVGNKKYVSFYKLEDYPVFIKAGGIIPLTSVNELMSTNVPKELEIHVFPGKNNSYNLYEDDGLTNSYKDGNYSITNIDYNYLTNNYTLIIRNVEGKPDLLFKTRDYKIMFRNTKQAESVSVYLNDQPLEFQSFITENDFILEIKNVDVNGQLTINCQGKDIEIDALMLLNDDIDSILSDMEVLTILKDDIARILFDKEMSISKKRIEIRKLKSRGLDKRSIKVFLRLLEYMNEV